MRSFTTATRFDHGSQVDGIHARRIEHLSEEKIPNCGTAFRITPVRQPNLANSFGDRSRFEAATPGGRIRCFAGSRHLFALAEESIHLRDDRFQLPGVPLAPRLFLKLTPTLGFLKKVGPVWSVELCFRHRLPHTLLRPLSHNQMNAGFFMEGQSAQPISLRSPRVRPSQTCPSIPCR